MIKIDNFVLDPALPISLIGTKLDSQINFMNCAWFTRLEVSPYLYGISIQKQHFTHKAITQNKVFSINIPSTDLIPKVDAVGVSSGREYDKSNIFEVFKGEIENAPIVKGSIVSFECELINSFELAKPTEEFPRAHTLFVGQVKNVWADKSAVEGSNLSFNKLKPIFWTWSPRNYWEIGAQKELAFNFENKKLVSKKE